MPEYLWRFILPGYLFTIAIELPILLFALSRRHPLSRRLVAGVWLTACTYPIVVLVMPLVLPIQTNRGLYLAVAEVFAPLAECVLFGVAFHAGSSIPRGERVRDYAGITVANVASFVLGELAHRAGWLDFT